LGVLGTQRRAHIDLFDDPSWDSQEGQEEAAAYGWITLSGFSAKTECVVLLLSLSLWLLGIAAMALLVLAVMGLLSFHSPW
jgi:hypothetical protein